MRSLSSTTLDEESDLVLYLRAFRKDTTPRRLIRSNTLASLGWSLGSPSLYSLEEELAEAVRPLGRLVAVGYPDERDPPLGAERTYLSHDAWQGEIRGMLERAKLVVLRPGRGEGIAWELREARRLLTPERLVLLVWRLGRSERRVVSDTMKDTFGRPLPDGAPEVTVTFSHDWEPSFRRKGAKESLKNLAHSSPLRPTKALLRYHLGPKLQELGAEPAPVPWHRSNVGALLFLWVAFAAVYLLGWLSHRI
jgi:hypothetical protein